jgi:hypothetical protein
MKINLIVLSSSVILSSISKVNLLADEKFIMQND